jgi:hypothetical protein
MEYLTILRHMYCQNRIQEANLKAIIVILFMSFLVQDILAQTLPEDPVSFFEPSPSFSKKRFWTITLTGTTIYAGTIIGLNELWYKQYPREKFHFFNDWQEWNQMDKAGHIFTTYFESHYAYKAARWTGIKEKDAIWLGAGIGFLVQASVEVLDGFSSNWGFSVPDFAFNAIGATAFLTQQSSWGEQRITFKVSTTKRSYSRDPLQSVNGNMTSSLYDRTENLFGSNLSQTFLKDYNAQTIWASVNIASFLKKESRFPKWLNMAIGYGSENMYGGFENKWEVDGFDYALDPEEYPRYRQFYLAPDIDLTRIPTRKPFIKTLLFALNIFKFPTPAIEWNTEGKFKFHVIHY